MMPQRLLHQGVVHAQGFWLDTTLLSLEQVRARALALWSPGVTFEEVPGGLLVRLAAPRWSDCLHCTGAPLVEQGGILLAAPLLPRERAALTLSAGDVVLVREGEFVVVPYGSRRLVDASAWIDLDGFVLHEVTPLGPPPAAPVVVRAAPNLDVRAVLGDNLRPVAPDAAAVIRSLQGAAPTSSESSGATPNLPTRSSRGAPGVLASLARALTFALAPWARARRSGPASTDPASARGLVVRPRDEAGSAWLSRLQAAAQTWLARALLATRLASFVGRKQAAYLGRMMRMFEQGDLHEALRHGIPLGALEGLGNAAPSLTVPTPRDALAITSQGARSGLHVADELQAHLRHLYRQAVERLVAQERIEEAAFVLAELLRASEEAVALLERHGRTRLAAEVAEARQLAPALVVRQWLVAGDMTRAVQVATRTGCFAAAVALIEKRDGTSPTAQALRLQWADRLARAGNEAQAVRVAQKVPGAQRLVALWMDHVLQGGGPAAAAMLVVRWMYFSEHDADTWQRLQTLLDDSSEAAQESRLACYQALVDSTSAGSPRMATLARKLVRAALRDTACSVVADEWLNDGKQARLLAMANDAVLAADMPPSVQIAPRILLAQRTTPLLVSLGATDVGTLRVTDAVWLPNGRVAVALGEAGARLYDRSGRCVMNLDEPAHRLVVSDAGTRALALAPRGEAWRIARVNLTTGQTESWCEIALTTWADTFDGETWLVATDSALLLIDTLSTGWAALAQLPLDEREESVRQISREQYHMSCAVLMGIAGGWGIEHWQLELPELTVRHRWKNPSKLSQEEADDPTIQELVVRMTISVNEAVAIGIWAREKPEPHLHVTFVSRWVAASQTKVFVQPIKDVDTSLPLIISKQLIAFVTTFNVLVLNRAGDRCLQIDLERAANVSLRFANSALTVADDQGRVVVFDTTDGHRIADVRIH